jgi:hypothetical protein
MRARAVTNVHDSTDLFLRHSNCLGCIVIGVQHWDGVLFLASAVHTPVRSRIVCMGMEYSPNQAFQDLHSHRYLHCSLPSLQFLALSIHDLACLLHILVTPKYPTGLVQHPATTLQYYNSGLLLSRVGNSTSLHNSLSLPEQAIVEFLNRS